MAARRALNAKAQVRPLVPEPLENIPVKPSKVRGPAC